MWLGSILSQKKKAVLAGLGAMGLALTPTTGSLGAGKEKPQKIDYSFTPPAPQNQTWDMANDKSTGCVSCHTDSDQKTMHATPAVVLGCVDCHGGDASVNGDNSWGKSSLQYMDALTKAHVLPKYPKSWHWPSSANPKRSYTLLNSESPEFVRFVNPSDYRVARESCGACHMEIIEASERSLMATGAMLWGGAAYNNGIVPFKNYVFGEAYTRKGLPATIKSPGSAPGSPHGTVTDAEKKRGALPILYPLPTWHTIPPGDVFRVFERGGRNINTQFPEIGLPNIGGIIQRLEEPGRPDLKQSNRGPGTGLRVAIPALNIHKTRLNDPFMWFMGTNDQPGDYRQSGCAGCHVVYANDREPRHSSIWAKYGRDGQTQTVDPTIRDLKEGEHRVGKFGTYDASYAAEGDHGDKGGHGGKDDHGDGQDGHKAAGHPNDASHGDGHDADTAKKAAHDTIKTDAKREKGHPIQHAFTRAIPTAQCMNCHMHQPNIFLNSYLGYTMWDYESDAPYMWPGPDNKTPRPEGMSDEEYQKKYKQ